MNSVIWKYSIPDGALSNSFEMPTGAQILCAQEQHGAIQLWALVVPKGVMEQRHFTVVMTGHNHNVEGYQYIDTVQIGWLVLHIFETPLTIPLLKGEEHE